MERWRRHTTVRSGWSTPARNCCREEAKEVGETSLRDSLQWCEASLVVEGDEGAAKKEIDGSGGELRSGGGTARATESKGGSVKGKRVWRGLLHFFYRAREEAERPAVEGAPSSVWPAMKANIAASICGGEAMR